LNDINNREESTKINFASAAFKKYFVNTSWLFFERIFRLLLVSFVYVYMARYLGPENLGILSYAIAFVALFSAVSNLGLDNIIVRELVKDPDKKEYYLGTVFILRLLGSIIAIIGIIITLALMNSDSFISLIIIIISASTLFQSFYVIDFYFQSIVKSKYSVIAQFFSLLFTSTIKILLIVNEAPLLAFAVITSLEFLFISTGFVLSYKFNNNNLFLWRFDKQIAAKLLKDSWPLILSGIAISLYMKIDQVMIKEMLDEEQVGYYAAAVRICEAWYFIPIAIVTSLFPAIINAKQKSEQLYRSRLQKLYDLLAFIAIIIAIPVTILNEQITLLLFGTEFLPTASVLTIYIWAGLAVGIGVATNQYLVTENYTKFSFYRTFAGTIINIFLNLLLIPHYGINGSAIATLISFSMVAFSVGFSSKTSYQSMMLLKSIFLVNIFKLVLSKIRK
jgi:O-antigen/teichoic acid export membrane protein